jgi:biotin operon repressor
MQPVAVGLQTAQLELASGPPAREARVQPQSPRSRFTRTSPSCTTSAPVASRHRVGDMLDIKLSIVDSHIKTLKDDGRIVCVVNGIYEPAAQYEQDRAMTLTGLQAER